ncbi:MAG: nucleotidyltransferase domain-containing protein [Candidatus Micrarchaeota archaeon]
MQTLRLIATEKKIRLLERLLYSSEPARVRSSAKELGMNPGYVSTLMKKMSKERLLENGRASADPRIQALRLIFNIDRLVAAWARIRRLGVKGFGVFGSWAKGANTEASDLDVWVKVDKEPGAESTSEIRGLIKQATGAGEVSLITLTENRIAEMRRVDPPFYSTLLNSFHIGGEKID